MFTMDNEPPYGKIQGSLSKTASPVVVDSLSQPTVSIPGSFEPQDATEAQLLADETLNIAKVRAENNDWEIIPGDSQKPRYEVDITVDAPEDDDWEIGVNLTTVRDE